MEPFDRSLPSPIEPVLQLRASAEGAVAVADALSDDQRRRAVDTGLELRILDTAIQDGGPELIVLSGSAGGGKSLAIATLTEVAPDAFGAWIEDATHSESPSQDQVDRLRDFFTPFTDGAAPAAGKPRIIAMNTGMVIRFFAALRSRAPGGHHSLTELEAHLKSRMGLSEEQPTEGSPMAQRVLVVNLDHRPTTGGPASLFSAMLRSLDPGRPAGIMAGAARCESCQVRGWCFVRTNAEIASSAAVTEALDSATDRIALERGRPLPPRALWDLTAQLITGGEPFAGPEDPCDTIAAIAAADDRERVWRRVLPNGIFIAGDPSGLAAQVAALDPSFAPSSATHDLLARTGIDPDGDAADFVSWLAPDPGKAEAVPTAASAMSGPSIDRAEAARAMVRAAFISGRIPLPGDPDAAFSAALAEYSEFHVPQPPSLAALQELRDLIATALARTFGEEAGPERFFQIDASDPRRPITVMAGADLQGELLEIAPDPVVRANLPGAEIAGYRPLAVTIRLADVELPIGLGLYRVLRQGAAGTLPSSADLAHFFALRRAVEAIGRVASADHDRPLLITDRTAGRRYRVAQRRDIRGQNQIAVQEVLS